MSRQRLLKTIKVQTGIGLGPLHADLERLARRENDEGDLGLTVAHKVLAANYADGAHLVRATDTCFWAYNGKHWERTSDEQVKRKILGAIEAEVPPGVVAYSAILESAFKLLIALRAAPGDVLRLTEEPPPVINCQNGELWIAEDGTVELRAHRADSYLTYVLEVNYDPRVRCPMLDRALMGIFWKARGKHTSAADMVRHFNEVMGYAIQPLRDIPSWVLGIGPGSDGKTKLFQTITEKLINKQAVFSDRIDDIEHDRFKRGALAGKLILLDDDVDTGTKLPDGFLKSISERKLMSGQHKFKNNFEFISCAFPVLLANNPPTSADLSWGLRRRALIIPFARTFYKSRAEAAKQGDPRAVDDVKLFPRIWQTEMSGVLNRALQGLRRLRQRGRFEEPMACVEARRKWLAAANPLVAFIGEQCDQVPDASMLLKEFYKQFREWAVEAGIRAIPPRNTLKHNLEGLGYRTKDTSSGTAVVGLLVRLETEEPF